MLFGSKTVGARCQGGGEVVAIAHGGHGDDGKPHGMVDRGDVAATLHEVHHRGRAQADHSHKVDSAHVFWLEMA